jgi:hypothetical protein
VVVSAIGRPKALGGVPSRVARGARREVAARSPDGARSIIAGNLHKESGTDAAESILTFQRAAALSVEFKAAAALL